MNSLYPVFMKLEHKPVLVVGGGRIAEQKVLGLLDANARVTVIAPEVTAKLGALAANGTIQLERRVYAKDDVRGYLLVFGATNHPDVHAEIVADADRHSILTNIVDVPELCGFYLASLFTHGDLKIAVSTNGKSPTLGKLIRDKIASEFSEGYPQLLERLSDLRPVVHSSIVDPDQRKTIFENIVEREAAGYLGEKREESSTPNRGGREPGIEKSGVGKGVVSLVGAGPGDAGLITVKGRACLEQAEVIVYDALINRELLAYAPVNCEIIYAGKRSGCASMSQEEINQLLVEKAKAGKKVVRLKGGDPFVFGRGGEELKALRQEGIEAIAIPGITAGIGAATAAGIPLTHRSMASNVCFVSGAEASASGRPVNWNAVAGMDTIVVYMGIKTIRTVAARLCEAGLDPETRAVVVFGGTTDDEVLAEGSVATIADEVEGVHTTAPGILIIGEVVNFFAARRERISAL
jgi:uroporphyrin-III C-methyltransferase / precorrin-2 dehydrogenase / sirohydrochlorin ferrochelatase